MFNQDNRFLRTKEQLKKEDSYIKMMETFNYYQRFFDKMYYDTNNFDFLLYTYDDNMNPIKGIPINLRLLIRNISNTIYSSKKCFEVINVSDGFTLLRKLKDDLFFIILLLQITKLDVKIYDNKEKVKNFNNIVAKIKAWLKNRMEKLTNQNIKTILNYDNNIKQLSKDTSYFNDLEILTNDLNNFVHTNGLIYLDSQNPLMFIDKTIEVTKEVTMILSDLIARSFVLMFYISETHFRRTDFIDYVEAGDNTPEFLNDRAHEVDTFYVEYINNRLLTTHPKFVSFIKKHTSMINL